MIRNGRHDQVIQDMRRSVRDNLWFSSELDEPFIYRCAILRNLASGIVVVPGADRNASYLCQFADPSTDLPRLKAFAASNLKPREMYGVQTL
jgi:hypothetical protein